ncbi:MAG: hypothetical protein BGN96_12225 [Bacteroidales bacterium 45-6]|nr:MAG: hypothetical protein BGN96_12225 [Bacteroidales bacterium 45-6]
MANPKTKTKTKEVTWITLNKALIDLQVDFYLRSQEVQARGKKFQLSHAETEGRSISKFECDEFELYIAIKEKEVCHG